MCGRGDRGASKRQGKRLHHGQVALEEMAGVGEGRGAPLLSLCCGFPSRLSVFTLLLLETCNSRCLRCPVPGLCCLPLAAYSPSAPGSRAIPADTRWVAATTKHHRHLEPRTFTSRGWGGSKVPLRGKQRGDILPRAPRKYTVSRVSHTPAQGSGKPPPQFKTPNMSNST